MKKILLLLSISLISCSKETNTTSNVPATGNIIVEANLQNLPSHVVGNSAAFWLHIKTDKVLYDSANVYFHYTQTYFNPRSVFHFSRLMPFATKDTLEEITYYVNSLYDSVIAFKVDSIVSKNKGVNFIY